MDGRLAIEIRLAQHLSEEFWEQCLLRFKVLRLDLDIPFEIAKYRRETAYQHIIAIDNGEVVGSAVLIRLDGARSQVRAVAVSPKLQGKGIGAQIMAECERIAMSQGVREIILNARLPAIPFYERIGYLGQGDQFDEVGIPHLKMAKTLP